MGLVAAVAAVLALVSLGSAFVNGPAPSRGSGLPRGLRAESPKGSVTEVARAAEVPLREISEAEFWKLQEEGGISEAVIKSWSKKQLSAFLTDGTAVSVLEESDPEDLRNRLVREGVTVRYPPGDNLSEEQALEATEYGSEGAVASGLLAAVAVGIADSVLEIGGAVTLTGAELEGQSLFEKESIGEVLAEDAAALSKDLQIIESLAEQEASQAESAIGGTFASVTQWFQDVAHGLVANHAPGIGGIIEDGFMGLLTFVSLFSLYQMALLKRKSNSFSGIAHTATGAMQIVIVLYAILEERCLRESPGAVWAVGTWIIFMVNNITMWPLLKYFKGPEYQRVLFKLAYSFIISFQGIHAIAWSIQYEWLYWVVMPFWFYSVKKLAESSDNIFALMPDGTVPVPGLQEAARRRTKGLANDTTTLVYSILNFAGAVFDNLYMAVYTWRGPAGFWGWSAENIPGINDHLRTGLVKPAFGSLTISALVFMGTLVYRKKISVQLAIALNVVLASVGPWLILYYHKLVDWDEPWQPEIMGDWGSSPYIVNHWGDLGPLIASIPVAIMGSKAAVAAFSETAAPAASAAEVFDPAGLGGAAGSFDPAGLGSLHDPLL